jgi:hypothetical protein
MQVKLVHCIASQLLKVDVHPLLLTKVRKLASKADKATEWGKSVRVTTMLAPSLRLTPRSRLDKMVAAVWHGMVTIAPLNSCSLSTTSWQARSLVAADHLRNGRLTAYARLAFRHPNDCNSIAPDLSM